MIIRIFYFFKYTSYTCNKNNKSYCRVKIFLKWGLYDGKVATCITTDYGVTNFPSIIPNIERRDIYEYERNYRKHR